MSITVVNPTANNSLRWFIMHPSTLNFAKEDQNFFMLLTYIMFKNYFILKVEVFLFEQDGYTKISPGYLSDFIILQEYDFEITIF